MIFRLVSLKNWGRHPHNSLQLIDGQIACCSPAPHIMTDSHLEAKGR